MNRESKNFHHQIKQRLFPRKHPSAASYGFFTLFRFATVVHFVRGGFGGTLCSRFFCFSSTALAAARYLLALLRCASPTSSTKFIWISFTIADSSAFHGQRASNRAPLRTPPSKAGKLPKTSLCRVAFPQHRKTRLAHRKCSQRSEHKSQPRITALNCQKYLLLPQNKNLFPKRVEK